MESKESNDDNSIARTLTDDANPPTVAASGTSASNDENTSHFNTARTSNNDDDDDVSSSSSEEDELSERDYKSNDIPESIDLHDDDDDELTAATGTVATTSLSTITPLPAKPNPKKLKEYSAPSCLEKTKHTKCGKAYDKQKARADYAQGELSKHEKVAKSLHSTATALSKNLTASQKKVTMLAKQNIAQKQAKNTVDNQLSNAKVALKIVQHLKTANSNHKTALGNEKRMNTAEKANLDQQLSAEKTKTKEKTVEIKKLEKEVKELKAKADASEKKSSKVQGDFNALTLKHAELVGNGGGSKKRPADQTLEEKKDLMNHQSEVRLQEKVFGAQITQMSQQRKESQQSSAKTKRFNNVVNMLKGNGGVGGGMASLGGLGNMGQTLGGMITAGGGNFGGGSNFEGGNLGLQVSSVSNKIIPSTTNNNK